MPEGTIEVPPSAATMAVSKSRTVPLAWVRGVTVTVVVVDARLTFCFKIGLTEERFAGVPL
jgi:hypothetical protein